MNIERVIKRPLVLTEKGNSLRESENKYLFEVDQEANKAQIRNAVETLFNVRVLDVHTMVVRGRLRRMGRGHAKTKSLMGALDKLGVTKARESGKASKALVVDAASNEKLRLSIRNCKDHQFLPPEGVNVYDLLRHDHLVLSQDAAKALEARLLAKKNGAAK